MKKAAWPALVFSLGFFALAAQTLLFRGFLAAFEGSELGVGLFFGSWLTWVALGAPFGRAYKSKNLISYALLYLPAFLLQFYLIENVRRLEGIASYEPIPFGAMLAASFLANAPMGLLTGFLFTTACGCAPAESNLPVARVYILEALGAFAGGVAVTLLLRAGAAAETVFLLAALPLTVAASLGSRPAVALPLALGACLVSGLDRKWAEADNRAAWGRLMLEEHYRGSFATAQGRAFYGERAGDFLVMSWGGVTGTLPGRERASEVLALHLAQRPGARRVMVVGEGAPATALRFSELPQIERVAWLHPDPEYPRALWDVLPERFRGRVEIPGRDVREFARESPGGFDLILLDLPDVTTLAQNRYATREFFDLLKGALAPGGLVSVRVTGGENYVGGELAYLGSSMLATLEAVFPNVALKAGDESWFLGSDAEVSASPAELRDRFAAVPGAAALYPPEGLLSLYLPDRIAFQMEAYRTRLAEAGVNTERRPRALLYGMAAALRRAGIPLARRLPDLPQAVFWIAACGIGLYALLRAVYLFRSRSPGTALFDAGFLVFSAGMGGMALSVVLMVLFQSRFGSLYLYAGLMSSLFMLGLAGGGALRRGPLPGVAVFAGVLLLVHFAAGGAPWAVFAGLFALAGGAAGMFFPAAARRMQEAGRDAAWSGARLETADHLGGAAGAVLGALLFLPLCGTGATLILLGLLVGVNAVPELLPRRGVSEDRCRAAAYGVLGFAAFLLLASQVAVFVRSGREGLKLEAAAREMAPGVELQSRTTGGFTWFAAGDGYIFRTRPLAGGISGYGGPLDIAVRVDAAGRLLGMRILESSETPVYQKMTEAWQGGLIGRNIFQSFDDVHAVTGATVTSDALTRTLEEAGRNFAGRALGRRVAAGRGGGVPVEAGFFWLAGLAAAAIIVRYHPRRWLRQMLLMVSFAVAGLWLNLQYSPVQVFSLLSPPSPGLTAAFFLAAGVPLLVALFGNIYCGSMCPFGAMQELAGELKGRRGMDPGRDVWRRGRAVKYGLLALLAAAFALTRDPSVFSADPLVTFFSDARSGWVLGLGLAVTVLALVFRRFWCRNLCPAGAFLSLVSGLRLLRRITPLVRPDRCDMGVRTSLDLDCLRCDRCRHEAK